MERSWYPVALGIIMLAVAGCTASAASVHPSAGHGGTFSVAELEPPSFVPGQNEGGATDELNAIYAPLTKFNAQSKLTDV